MSLAGSYNCRSSKDLAERLGIEESGITDSRSIEYNAGTTDRYPVGHSWSSYTIGLVVGGSTYIYDGHFDSNPPEEHSLSVKFTGLVIPTAYDEKGNLVLYGQKEQKHDPESNVINAAKTDLSKRLGIDEKHITGYRYVVQESPELIPGSWRFRVGLVYEGSTYIYGGGVYIGLNGESSLSVKFTGLVIPTAYDEEGNLILYEKKVENATEIEVNERKAVEDKIALQAKDQMVTGEMAEKSETLELKKK